MGCSLAIAAFIKRWRIAESFTTINLHSCRLFAEGAFAQAFVPVLSEVKTREGDEAVAELVRNTLGTLAGILFLLSIFAAIAAPN